MFSTYPMIYFSSYDVAHENTNHLLLMLLWPFCHILQPMLAY